jgi:hypothetical protein
MEHGPAVITAVVSSVESFVEACNVNYTTIEGFINPLNAELNPIRHLLALLGAHHFVYVSRVRVNKLQVVNVGHVESLKSESLEGTGSVYQVCFKLGQTDKEVYMI